MYRLHDAASGQECSEQTKGVREADQDHVPGFQHVALFLDHDRVQVGRGSEPGHERRILDRIPGPVPAPAQDFIGPAATENDARTQSQPREEAPAPSGSKPFRSESPSDECRESESKWRRKAGKAQVEHDRVNKHDRMLQKWIETRAVGEDLPGRNQFKRRGQEFKQDQKEAGIG